MQEITKIKLSSTREVRYIAHYTKGSGLNRVRINRRFKTKSEATSFIAEQTLKYNSNGQLFRRQLLVSDYLKYWLKLEKVNVSVATLQTYKATMSHIRLVLPRTTMCAINRQMLQNAVNILAQRYAHETLRKDVNHLRAMFRSALRMGDISKNPMEDIVIPKGSKAARSVDSKVMSADDFCKVKQLLLKYTKGNTSRNYMVMLIIVFTGMRVGEALALTIDSFNFEENTVTIKQAWKCLEKKVGETKTVNAHRTIPVPPDVLERIKKFCGSTKAASSISPDKDRLIFEDAFSNVPSPSTINSAFKTLQKRLDIEGNFSIHMIRHTIASLLIEKQADIVQVSRLLGHSSPKVTATYYLGLVPDKDLKNRQKLMNMLR
ncbi:tyrosine-type recombinase/integrase [Liquorilactobacillus hordei]|uniref:tyrosine-type recombinase/integrase n=1 Tax=Liquorilactobacillus hordei TaxID=468911 RepID=UPI0039E832F7